MTFKVKIGKFGGDDSADITVDGRVVGWLERVRGERFASVTSRARVSFVSHYSIMLTDDVADEQLSRHDVSSLAEAKSAVACAFERAWKQLADTTTCRACDGDGTVEADRDTPPNERVSRDSRRCAYCHGKGTVTRQEAALP